MSSKTEKYVENLNNLLTQTRNTLFDWSRDYLQSDDASERSRTDALFELAKRADSLRREITEISTGKISLYPPSTVEDVNEKIVRESNKPSQGRSASRKRKKDYPKYTKRGDALVKIGLSRDKKKEYKHLVPAEEYQKVIELLKSICKSKKEFNAEELVEAFDGASYHPYIVLALLKQYGLVKLVRRGIYAFKSVNTLQDDIAAVWQNLKEENA